MHKVHLTLNQDKRRRFDSYPGSIGAGQGLAALVERLGSGQHFTLACTHSGDAEVPLPEVEGEREQVWRPGFGWVDRPVEVPEVPAEQVAAA